MQKYTVQINKDNYFSVDSKIIESGGEIVRIVNLRSISGVIGEKFDLSDPKLKEIIHHYLVHSNNIELLNIYSRKLNGYNWFEIYVNQESSEKQAQNEHVTYVTCSKSNEKTELSEYIKISNELDESKINPELKDKMNHIIPSKLYENLNPQIPKFQKKINLESIDFVTFLFLIHKFQRRFIIDKSH